MTHDWSNNALPAAVSVAADAAATATVDSFKKWAQLYDSYFL